MNRGLITAGDLSRDLQDKGFAVFMQGRLAHHAALHGECGLRYELTTVLTEANNLMGNFIPVKACCRNRNQQASERKVFNGDHNNFAPRLGFAWDIAGNGKTVIRGGGGIYFEQGSFDSFMAIGNLLGLRTTPTGVNLYANGNPTPFTAGGTINVGQITFTGAGLGSATTPGTVKYGWANNSSSVPIYSLSPSCGDGTVTLASGLQAAALYEYSVLIRTSALHTWPLITSASSEPSPTAFRSKPPMSATTPRNCWDYRT